MADGDDTVVLEHNGSTGSLAEAQGAKAAVPDYDDDGTADDQTLPLSGADLAPGAVVQLPAGYGVAVGDEISADDDGDEVTLEIQFDSSPQRDTDLGGSGRDVDVDDDVTISTPMNHFLCDPAAVDETVTSPMADDDATATTLTGDTGRSSVSSAASSRQFVLENGGMQGLDAFCGDDLEPPPPTIAAEKAPLLAPSPAGRAALTGPDAPYAQPDCVFRFRHSVVRRVAFAGDVDAEEVRVCVEALAAVRHPNLVALTAFCAEPPAMLVEYFASETLENYIFSDRRMGVIRLWRKQGRFTFTWDKVERRQILLDVARALTALHSAGIVHGALRTTNVLLTKTHPVEAKLAGFGVAEFTEPSAGDRHAAPEVDSGEAAASESSDVYSLAGIVFEALEDTRVNAASARALLGASGRNRPIHDKPLANRLGADLAAAIALARDPDRAARPRAALILDAIEVGVRFSGEGMSVLHHYAVQDRVADAGAFLDGPLGGTAALNAETARRESALYMAATAGHERFVAMLLAYATGDDEAGGLNVNTNASGKTALYAAAEHRHAHVARILANHGVDVNCATRKGNTALHMAVSNGDLATVEVLLAAGADAEVETRLLKRTAISDAVVGGSVGIVRALIAAGADINRTYPVKGDTLLHLAVGSDDPELIDALVDVGLEVGAHRSGDNCTPLHLAARGKQ